MEETEMDEINHHYLSPGTELSGGRYKIEKLVAPGGRMVRASSDFPAGPQSPLHCSWP